MKFITSLFAMAVCGLAYAQDRAVEPAASVPPVVEEQKFTASFDITTTLFDFDDGNITEVDTELLFDVSKTLKLGASLPFINDSNDYYDPYGLAWQLSNGIYGRSGSGLSDLDVFAIVNIIDGKCEYLKNDHVWFDITGGFKIPLDGTYSSDDTVPHIGAEIGGEWGDFSLSYGFSYEFVDEYTFSAPLGGFVNDDIYEGIASLGWKATDELGIHLNATQYHWNGEDLFLIGPGFEYQLNERMTLGADLAIPTNGDTDGGNLDICMSAGIGFKF